MDWDKQKTAGENIFGNGGWKNVGETGFEPMTSCSQGRRANRAALLPAAVKGNAYDTASPKKINSPGAERAAVMSPISV